MPEAVDRPADVDRVYEELKRAIDRDARDPATMRGLAERFWPVSAEKPLDDSTTSVNLPPRSPSPPSSQFRATTRAMSATSAISAPEHYL